jgi:hypothetical protein
MKLAIFFLGIVTAYWQWEISGPRWLKYILLVVMGFCLGSYGYDVATICVIPKSAHCSWF